MLTMKQHSSKRSRCLLFYRVVIFTSFVHTRLVSQHVPTWSFSSSPISATNNTIYRISTQMHLSVWTFLKVAHILVQCWYVNAFTSMKISVPCKCYIYSLHVLLWGVGTNRYKSFDWWFSTSQFETFGKTHLFMYIMWIPSSKFKPLNTHNTRSDGWVSYVEIAGNQSSRAPLRLLGDVLQMVTQHLPCEDPWTNGRPVAFTKLAHHGPSSVLNQPFFWGGKYYFPQECHQSVAIKNVKRPWVISIDGPLGRSIEKLTSLEVISRLKIGCKSRLNPTKNKRLISSNATTKRFKISRDVRPGNRVKESLSKAKPWRSTYHPHIFKTSTKIQSSQK